MIPTSFSIDEMVRIIVLTCGNSGQEMVSRWWLYMYERFEGTTSNQ
jgi:hypothetical protein